ncbi:hypothetical protein [Chryseobacterium sp. ERMR1:04]|uniref:hypothetical protein n=1 Tax=Chryseobacterium sp. ERMR1:04 TaxID=1705393 RepID=UPI0006C8A748|nr:hypothetical protein [Chryseobacterium sp. ERMR1:04]KPH12435.1 hypothetical protein AMQ68_16115 [Chryseobacterium sp. ERMR1:04]
MTYNEFYNNINRRNNIENRDLETYLLALLKLVEQEIKQPLTADLLSKLLLDAFTSEPKEFESEWLKIVEAPDEKTIYENIPHTRKDSSEDIGVYYSIAVLKFQIAELHKMKGKQLDDKEKYFGIDSETGNRWYNFDPDSILECGMSCFLDHGGEDDEEFEVSWQTLGDLLEMGRIYE